MGDVVTRYAPSPTGTQHVGNLRTALFSYYFAKSNGGKFYLRFEDTDRERYEENAMENISNELKQLDIIPDKTFIQSERLRIYQEAAQTLIDNGIAYRCYCTKEELAAMEKGYNLKWRNKPRQDFIGKEYVIRLKMPLTVSIDYTLPDALLGNVKFNTRNFPVDPIILKSDGYPTYHLASVVDDYLMGITHVFRGQEWLSSSPIHMQLYKAFGWEMPIFCHLPTINDSTGKKLSKRSGISVTFRDLTKEGILIDALKNYIMMIGWNPKNDDEILTPKEITERFSIDGIQKGSGIFDYTKLLWFNKQYFQKLNEEEINDYILNNMVFDMGSYYLNKIIDKKTFYDTVKPRISNKEDCRNLIKLFFDFLPRSFPESEKLKEKNLQKIAEIIPPNLDMPVIYEIIKNNLTADINTLREESIKYGIKFKNLMLVFRACLVANKSSPSLTDIIKIIGEKEAKKRIEYSFKLLRGE